MTTIETTVDIGPNRQLAIQLPDEVAPGRHRVILQIDEAHQPQNPSEWLAKLPRLDLGPWPTNLNLRREDMYADDGR
jgi:hypothetical protein